MTRTIEPPDNSFAISTGSNINGWSGVSIFDSAPLNTFNLSITSMPGDTDPYLYEVGETYQITYSDANGTYTIAAAQIVRSDRGPHDQGGSVVFSGVDQNGKLTHVSWAPAVDLQAWYLTSTSGGRPAGFYNTDQNANYTHRYVCFGADALIQTATGLRAAGDLGVGDPVRTVDHGLQPLIWVGRKSVAGYGVNAPVLFAPGAIGNRQALRLSQQHRIMLQDPLAEMLFGTAEVLVPAKALINGDDIRYAPCKRITYVHLMLDRHEILDGGDGAPCESLLCGDQTALHEIAHPAQNGNAHIAARPVLTYREALLLTGRATTKQSQCSI